MHQGRVPLSAHLMFSPYINTMSALACVRQMRWRRKYGVMWLPVKLAAQSGTCPPGGAPNRPCIAAWRDRDERGEEQRAEQGAAGAAGCSRPSTARARTESVGEDKNSRGGRQQTAPKSRATHMSMCSQQAALPLPKPSQASAPTWHTRALELRCPGDFLPSARRPAAASALPRLPLASPAWPSLMPPPLAAAAAAAASPSSARLPAARCATAAPSMSAGAVAGLPPVSRGSAALEGLLDPDAVVNARLLLMSSGAAAVCAPIALGASKAEVGPAPAAGTARSSNAHSGAGRGVLRQPTSAWWCGQGSRRAGTGNKHRLRPVCQHPCPLLRGRCPTRTRQHCCLSVRRLGRLLVLGCAGQRVVNLE